MAKIPDQFDLSSPAPLRTGVGVTPADTSAFGRGIASGGQAIAGLGDQIQQQQNTTDVARATAYQDQQNLALSQKYQEDPNYATHGVRSADDAKAIVATGAGLIRDPRVRNAWQIEAGTQAVRTSTAIGERGYGLAKADNVVKFDEANDALLKIYTDPNSSSATAAKAYSDMQANLNVAHGTGLLTPDQYAQRNASYLQAGDYQRGLNVVASDPSAIGKQLPTGADSLIKGAEGFKSQAYWDVNHWRVGYGSDTVTMPDGSVKPVDKNTVIGQADADRDLQRRVGQTQQSIIGAVGQDSWDKLKAPAQAALTSMGYNYGTLPADVVSAVKSGDPGLISYAVERHASDNGGVNHNRRTAEAGYISGSPEPAWFNRITPEQQRQVYAARTTAITQQQVQAKGSLDTVVQNAPAAIASTGSYSGQLPTQGQFVAAYGPVEGPQKAIDFNSAVSTSQKLFNMRTASAADITQMLADAAPKSTGNDAAAQAKSYSELTAAANTTLAARKSDPSGYVQSAFPAVRQAWADAQKSNNFQPAIAATATAQTQIGIAPEDQKLLPAAIATSAAAKWKQADLPQQDRVGAITGLVFSTKDPMQQRAIFNQLVASGVPDIATGAMAAVERGDMAAADQLFRAALVDPTKLPGVIEAKTTDIRQKIQDQLFGDNGLATTVYGLDYGGADSVARASQDGELLVRDAQLRLVDGTATNADDAVAKAERDVFGDKKVVSSAGYAGQAGMKLAIDSAADQQTMQAGFNGLLPQISDAAAREVAGVIKSDPSLEARDADRASGATAVNQAIRDNYVRSVMSNGYFANHGEDGFTFINGQTGKALPGADGKPINFTMVDILKAAKPKRNSADAAAADMGLPSGQLVNMGGGGF